MRNFVAKHPLMVGGAEIGILWLVAVVLAKLYSNYYLLIGIPAIVIYVGIFVFAGKWQWVCTNCGRESFFARNKYCSQCGGATGLIKKEKIRCPNGHQVDKWDKFCPKCSISLGEKSN